MKTLMQVIGSVAVMAMVAGVALAGDGAGPQCGAGRGGPGGPGGRGPRMGGNPPFMAEIDGVKQEMENHQAKMQETFKAIGEAVKAFMGEGAAEGGKEALQAAVAAKAQEVAPVVVDEMIRHHTAMADVLQANRDAAVTALAQKLSSRPGGGRGPRGAGGDGNRPGGMGPMNRGQGGGERGRGPRGAMGGGRGHGGRGGPGRLFGNLEGADAEMTQHQQTMQEIMAEVRAAGEDRDAAAEAAAPRLAEELIRHHEAMLALMQQNPEAVAAGLVERLKQGGPGAKGGQGGQGHRGPRGPHGPRGPRQEGDQGQQF